MKKTIWPIVVFISFFVLVLGVSIYAFFAAAKSPAEKECIIYVCLIVLFFLTALIFSLVMTIKDNRRIKHQPYTFKYIEEFEVYKRITTANNTRVPRKLKKAGRTIPDRYSKWKKEIEDNYSTIKNNEDFYHYLKSFLRSIKTQNEGLTIILVPSELAIVALLIEQYKDTNGYFFLALASMLFVVIIMTVELAKCKREMAYISDVIDILCPDFNNVDKKDI